MAIIITEHNDQAAPDGGPQSDNPSETHLKRITGTIHRVNHDKGFGFIRCHNTGRPGLEYFAHCTAFQDRAELEEGLEVTFIPGHRSTDLRKLPPAYSIRRVTAHKACA